MIAPIVAEIELDRRRTFSFFVDAVRKRDYLVIPLTGGWRIDNSLAAILNLCQWLQRVFSQNVHQYISFTIHIGKAESHGLYLSGIQSEFL